MESRPGGDGRFERYYDRLISADNVKIHVNFNDDQPKEGMIIPQENRKEGSRRRASFLSVCLSTFLESYGRDLEWRVCISANNTLS